MEPNKPALQTPEGKRHPIPEILTLGTDESCGLRILGENVCDRHARIERRDGRCILRDLRSATGSFLNGVRVSEAPLEDGDVVTLGDQELLFTSLSDQRQEEFPIRSKNSDWDATLQSLSSVAKTDFPLLLLGPSGTGKDILAQALHERSSRSSGPFISVNCSALTETLVESELFGHLKGSFTGAVGDRKGAFESARGGTLFLDEIGDLPYGLQAKLLRALENGEIRPVGADRSVKTDVRIFAATHQNLDDKIREGAFRADLYYRLGVVTIHPPALADRMEDFEGLLYHFARHWRVRFSHMAILELKKHSWPGNIRELRNLVARASALFPKTLITEDHVARLMDRTFSKALTSPEGQVLKTGTLPVIKEIERQMIIKRLIANKGNQRRTAQDLGMPKSTLHDRLTIYEIDADQFKG